jgi:hypothetical protein
MKDWDVTIGQIILLAIGGFFVYLAIGIFGYNRANYQPQTSFVYTMLIAAVMFGQALSFQEIRSYRAKIKL